MSYLQERAEIDVLIEKGFEVKTKVTSWMRLFKKERVWKVSRLPLGLMDVQTDLFFQLQISENKLYSESAEVRNDEIMNSVKNNARLCAEIVAVSILGNKTLIKLFRKKFANYLLWKLNSKELFEFTKDIFRMNDFQNFTTSIILLRAKRTTTPLQVIETKKEEGSQEITLSQPMDYVDKSVKNLDGLMNIYSGE